MKKYCAQKDYAFTLAEVLITLMVIGVLAVVTIPSLVQSWEERATVSQLRKTYAALQEAFKLAENENGPPDTWMVQTDGINKMKPFLSVVKECSSSNRGCFFDGYYKTRTNTEYAVNFGTRPAFLLKDGSAITRIWDSNSCSYVQSTNNYIGEIDGVLACTTIWVDINGIKPPNVFSRDMFAFSLQKTGIVPWGGGNFTEHSYLTHNTGCEGSGTAASYGWACARWVIERGNMEYLHKDTTW